MNFYFDYIGRAFTTKCSNFDLITQVIQHIGYSIIFGFHYDFGNNLLTAIGERIASHRTQVYITRFLHFIFNQLCPNLTFNDDVMVPLLKLTKRTFSDLLSKDANKANLFSLVILTQTGKFFIKVFL